MRALVLLTLFACAALTHGAAVDATDANPTQDNAAVEVKSPAVEEIPVFVAEQPAAVSSDAVQLLAVDAGVEHSNEAPREARQFGYGGFGRPYGYGGYGGFGRPYGYGGYGGYGHHHHHGYGGYGGFGRPYGGFYG